MATVIDITSRIKNEKKEIAYDGKTYPVDNSKNACLRVMAILESEAMGLESVDKALEILLGKQAVKDFSGFSFEDYLVPFFAAMAAVRGVSYEEIEKSFRDSGAGAGPLL